jgi:hypothetical protein
MLNRFRSWVSLVGLPCGSISADWRNATTGVQTFVNILWHQVCDNQIKISGESAIETEED